MQKQFITVKELYRNQEEYIGKTVKLAGWIRTSRGSKNFGFIELNDGSFFKNMQIIFMIFRESHTAPQSAFSQLTASP